MGHNDTPIILLSHIPPLGALHGCFLSHLTSVPARGPVPQWRPSCRRICLLPLVDGLTPSFLTPWKIRDDCLLNGQWLWNCRCRHRSRGRGCGLNKVVWHWTGQGCCGL